MMHRLAASLEFRMKGGADTFPNDPDFVLAFARNTDPELWEILESISSDENEALASAGLLIWSMQFLGVGAGGALPVWYDMKPSEYEQKKRDTIRKIEDLESDLKTYFPGLGEFFPALELIWPNREIPLRERNEYDDPIDQMAVDGWNEHVPEAEEALHKLFVFYDCTPDHPTVAGKNGVLRRIGQAIDSYSPERHRLPRNGPRWCRHFLIELDKEIQRDSQFQNLNRANQIRVMHHCLHFYSIWLDDQLPAGAWDEKQIRDSLGR